MSDKLGALLKSVEDRMSDVDLGRLLTTVDVIGVEALANKSILKPTRQALRLGITGPPGAGKSSIIGKAIELIKAKGLSIAVLAVDPSSPFSNGAILGDRIRYSEQINDQNIFVRSIGTRGSLGGLTASAYLMLRVFDHVGFDVVLIETVGVGQTELEIMNVADHVTVVLVPESGDSVQAMKAGLMEIADTFIVNKADRSGADSLANEIKISVNDLKSENEKEKQIFLTTATTGDGINKVVDHWLSQKDSLDLKKLRTLPKRLQAEAYALARNKLELKAQKGIQKIQTESELLRFVQSVK